MPKRVLLNIGPIRPSPSMAMGMSKALLLRRFLMTALPGIVSDTLYFVVGVVV